MTRDDAASIDDRLLGRLLACDALLRGGDDGPGRETSSPPSTDDEERARGRLLLLLRMLDVAEAPPGAAVEGGAGLPPAGEGAGRPLLGRFDVIEDLGAGGFGFVVRARDRILGREVALKMPLPERLLGAGDVVRSLREARAAARLDHPSIVRVYDAGEIGPLGYFIASEFCAGPSLRRWLKDQAEPVPARLAARWAATLADAVQHAHDRGILHRDIKPDNVILAPVGGPGGFVPRLTDFGLAKLVEEAGEETRSDARLGTLAYLAPERAGGRGAEVGPAADVYALGATLYEALTGRPPFRGETEAETLRLILESEPVPPRSLRPGLPRDLETICLKCLRKEPWRRYAAAGLRDDLGRFLEGRPIVGRPVSMAERAWGGARRRPGVAALVSLVVVLAGALIGGLAWWVTRLERHRRELELQVARADRHAEEALKQSRLAEERRRLADRLHGAEGLRRASEALDARQFELAQEILHDLRTGDEQAEPAGFAWRYLWRQANREFSQLWGHGSTVMGWAATPDARTLATWDLHGQVLVWDVAPGMEPDRPRAAAPALGRGWEGARLSPDGRLLAGIEPDPSGPRIRLIDAATGATTARLELEFRARIHDLRFDDEGRRLAACVARPDRTGEIRWWDLARPTDGPHRRPLGGRADLARFSADGRTLADVAGSRILLRDPWSGAVTRELTTSTTEPLGIPVFSADGTVLAADAGPNVVEWGLGTGREAGRRGLAGVPVGLVLGPRGRRLAVMDASGSVAVHDRESGRRRVLAPGEPRHIRDHRMSFSADETLLGVAIETSPGGAQPPEVWELATPRRIAVFPGRPERAFPSFFPGDRSLILTGGTGPRIWRLDPPGEPDELAGHAAEAWSAAYTPDGRILATGSDDTREPQTIRLWDPSTGRALASWKGHTATVSALAFSPDGRLLASGSLDAGAPGHPNVLLWDAASHRLLASLEGHTDRVRSVAFGPAGRDLATAGDDLTVRLWDVAGRTARAVLTGHSQRVSCVAFSPDGKTLASAANDATVRLWDVETTSPRAVLREAGVVNVVAFAPDGTRMATATMDGAIKLWDPATGEVVRTIRGDADEIRCLAFSPGGRDVAAAGKGKVVRIWDVATGREMLALGGHKARINALAFAPDGRALASCSHDGAVRLWHAGPVEAVPPRGGHPMPARAPADRRSP